MKGITCHKRIHGVRCLFDHEGALYPAVIIADPDIGLSIIPVEGMEPKYFICTKSKETYLLLSSTINKEPSQQTEYEKGFLRSHLGSWEEYFIHSCAVVESLLRRSQILTFEAIAGKPQSKVVFPAACPFTSKGG